jgi:PAS domain S-box-containing protein
MQQAKTYNIIVVEDNHADFELLQRELLRHDLSANFYHVKSEKELREALSKHKIDVVISDFMLPSFTGLEALRIFKEYNLSIPFITLTGTGAETIAVDMMKEGADDYVLKSHIERLYPSIITQEKKYQSIREKLALNNAILQSERAYRLLAENSNDVISLHNLSGDFLYASPAIYELSGYMPEEVLGKKLIDFFHEEDISKMRDQLDSIMHSDQRMRFEYRFRKKNGELIWIETSGKLLYDNDSQEPTEIVAVTRDATDRIIKDQQIALSEEQYRLIAENATDMITRHNIDGVYNYISNSSYTLLGYSPEDMIGKSAYDFLHPEDAEIIREGLMDFVKKGLGVYTASYRYKKKDGRYVWIESTNKLTYKDGSDTIEGVISISRDISERKAFELRLEEKIKELDTFIYRSSHDLKGPLASLQGLLNVAKSEIQDVNSLQYINLIERSVLHLDTILMDLLNITRITQGSINIVDINIPEVISNIIYSFENLPEFNDIKWNLDFSDCEILKLDKSLVNNIFQNLIINAIKYRDKNKQTSYINISTKRFNDELMVQIEDNGEGIPESLQRSVFDMFFRGNTKSTGTGLGLYIVKNAIEKLGGKIQLESKEKTGFIFTIYLPYTYNVEPPISQLVKNTML